MRFLRLAIVVLPLALAACGLSDQQKSDYGRVRESSVSSAVYDKMVHQDPLSVGDIRSLSHAGVSDAIILRYIRDQQTVYNLSSEDVSSLRKAGVSSSVVDYMLETPRRFGYYSYPGYYPPGWGSELGYGGGIGYWDPYWGYGYPYVGFGFGGGFGGGYHHHWH